MLFMVIEHFKNRDPKPIYERARERGRMLPEGLTYVNSWVEENFDRCFQLMECDNPQLFADWTEQWADLADFEIVRVVPSAEASEAALAGRALPLVAPRMPAMLVYPQPVPPPPPFTSIDMIRQRYARGEIDTETFDEMLSRLEESKGNW